MIGRRCRAAGMVSKNVQTQQAIVTQKQATGDAEMSNYPVDMSVTPEVKAFFDPDTNTISYVVKDPASNACAVVDSVMDIDYAAGRITYGHADRNHRLDHRQRTRARMDHRDPCSRRPSVSCALHSGEARRQDRHWRQDHGRAGHFRQESSTKAPSSSATARSSMPSSRTATPTRSVA
jgi:hypothetical protein